jgi:hypothetical protein
LILSRKWRDARHESETRRITDIWRSAAKLLTKDEARWIAANIAELPKLVGTKVAPAN